MARVLVVDDETSILTSLKALLAADGHWVVTASSCPEALEEALLVHEFDVVFTDLRLRECTGLEILRQALQRHPAAQVIVITGFATIETAVQAIKSGAYDYLTKPLVPEEVRATLQRALEKTELTREIERLRLELSRRHGFENLIGKSPAMQEVFTIMRQTAHSESNVLITGESGTGKELVARAIHYASARRGGRFVAVNCSAIPRELIEAELFGCLRGSFTGALRDRTGLIASASGGTLFLDEIGETSPEFQVKLLRVLQEGEFFRIGESEPTRVDLRVIAATNRDIQKALAAGNFREDLFYRLNVISLHLPPLRRRTEDIPLLALHFLNKYAAKSGAAQPAEIGADVLEVLMAHPHPGNVRELENIIEYAVAFSGGRRIGIEHLPPAIRSAIKGRPRQSLKPFRVAKLEFERHFITTALSECGGNISMAARLLDVHRQSLQQKIRELGLETERFRPEEGP